MTPFLTVLGRLYVTKYVTCRPPECPVDDRYGRPVIRFGIYAQSHPRVAVTVKLHRCSCIHSRLHNGRNECFSQAVQVNRPAVGVPLGNPCPLQVAVESSQQPSWHFQQRASALAYAAFRQCIGKLFGEWYCGLLPVLGIGCRKPDDLAFRVEVGNAHRSQLVDSQASRVERPVNQFSLRGCSSHQPLHFIG